MPRLLIIGYLIYTGLVTAATSDPTYQSLRDVGISDIFVVENIVLKRDVGTLTLKSGSIGFTTPTMGRDTVAVFLGEGEFSITPATSIEKNYLRSMTDQETLKESFDRAMFCFTDDTGKEIRSQAKTKAESRAAEALKDFRKHLRTAAASYENIEATLLTDLYRPDQPGFFSAYLHGRKHSDLRFHVKPRGAMPELSSEEVFLFNAQPVGVPDELLYLSRMADKAGEPVDKRIVEAQSYRVETTIAKNDHFDASTEIHFRALAGGDRVIHLALVPTLRVSRVSSSDQEIPFIQEDKKEDSSFYVILAKPIEKGADYDLKIEYQGDKVVHKAGNGNYSVGARESWYPNVNSFKDHARYDLTFKVPKQYTLVSVGKLAKEWKEGDFASSQWTSDAPLAVAGFNYGSFKKKENADSQSGVNIEGYANPEAPDYLKSAESTEAMGSLSPTRLTERTMVEAQNAMRIYTSWFGKSEFGRIAMTQQPEFNFGQSWPSLVYLPMLAYLDSTQRWRLLQGIHTGINEFVEEVTPHEVAHQWWGHMVGWSSYHDQWLSEGFADFSAALYLQLTEKSPDRFLKFWDHTREHLLEKNGFGRRANDAGPIWLGLRLGGEKNPGAYQRVVYGKGAYVLHMLRMLMQDTKEGDKPFRDMMQDFVRQHLNRNASTESFQRVVEQHMTPVMNAAGNGKMDWFFSEWVYGTAIPRYNLDYTLTDAGDGKVQLKGSLAQSEVPDSFIMQVPVYLDFDGQLVRLGRIRTIGAKATPFDVMLPKRPKRVFLNALHDVLEQ